MADKKPAPKGMKLDVMSAVKNIRKSADKAAAAERAATGKGKK